MHFIFIFRSSRGGVEAAGEKDKIIDENKHLLQRQVSQSHLSQEERENVERNSAKQAARPKTIGDEIIPEVRLGDNFGFNCTGKYSAEACLVFDFFTRILHLPTQYSIFALSAVP